MSCECFQIGGRYIGADPDCPAHGTDGYEGRVSELEAQVSELSERISVLEAEIGRLIGDYNYRRNA